MSGREEATVLYGCCHVMTGAKIIGAVKCGDLVALLWWMVVMGQPAWLLWMLVAAAIIALYFYAIQSMNATYVLPFMAKIAVTAVWCVLEGLYMFMVRFKDSHRHYNASEHVKNDPSFRALSVFVVLYGILHMWFFQTVYKCYEYIKAAQNAQVPLSDSIDY